MSRADTHKMRSHRSQRGYKPVCKTMANQEHKKRQAVNRMLGKMFPSATGELKGRARRREASRKN